MSVPKSRRNLSELEYFHNALELRAKVINLLLRDFGIKEKIREPKVLRGVKHIISDDDMLTLTEIFEKYGFDKPVIEKYPSWLINHFRVTIIDILKNMMLNITAATEIEVSTKRDRQDRRSFQNKAILCCEQLVQELSFICGVIPVNISKLMSYVGMIEEEINLLRNWRDKDLAS